MKPGCSVLCCPRSSYTCNYFVLPCCLHDFNCRFNNKVKGESNYRSYLSYVAEVGKMCGFDVEEDTLRIPSTKRVSEVMMKWVSEVMMKQVSDIITK